jgi:N-acetylmuramoyl-L-alanine amidase
MKHLGQSFALLLAVLFLSTVPGWAISTVVIDAGHGGQDRGGVPGQRYVEKIYTLDVAQRVKARLRAAGFKVVMTRDDDTFVGLGQRCAIANSQRDAVFLCIHFNSAPREGASGIETYYYSPQSASFAAAVHPRLVRAAGTEDRHIRSRGYYVLRFTRIPAVLVECGFLTNREEGGRIAGSSEHRQRLANALADAVIAKYK